MSILCCFNKYGVIVDSTSIHLLALCRTSTTPLIIFLTSKVLCIKPTKTTKSNFFFNHNNLQSKHVLVNLILEF